MGSKTTHAVTELAPWLDVERQIIPGGLVFSVSGELDASNAGVFREALVTTIDSRERDQGDVIIVNLSRVSFVDSVGLGTLVAGLKHAIERGVRVRLAAGLPDGRRRMR